MNRTATTFASAIGCVVLSLGCASATADHDSPRYSTNQAYYDYAKVVDVEPIVSRRYVSTPREECRVEHSGYYREVQRQPDHGGMPMLLGGLLGGVIGHQFGDGNGRKVSTVAGALIGGSLGHHAAHQHHRDRHRDRYRDDTRYDYVPRTERHCTVIEDVTEVEEVDGYNVTYRYQGQTFVKRTETHPGTRIRIRVEVTPSIAQAQTDDVFSFRSATLG